MDSPTDTEQATTFLCKKGQIPENGVLRIVIAGYPPLALYNLAGCFYATEDRCSHGEAALSRGFIEGQTIVCPLHFGSFDIRTGEAVDPPCAREIATYAVIVAGEDLLIRDR